MRTNNLSRWFAKHTITADRKFTKSIISRTTYHRFSLPNMQLAYTIWVMWVLQRRARLITSSVLTFALTFRPSAIALFIALTISMSVIDLKFFSVRNTKHHRKCIQNYRLFFNLIIRIIKTFSYIPHRHHITFFRFDRQRLPNRRQSNRRRWSCVDSMSNSNNCRSFHYTLVKQVTVLPYAHQTHKQAEFIWMTKSVFFEFETSRLKLVHVNIVVELSSEVHRDVSMVTITLFESGVPLEK